MNPKPITEARNPDLPAAWLALQRAALRARETAIQTGTSLVVMKDGKVTRISAAELSAVQHSGTK